MDRSEPFEKSWKRRIVGHSYELLDNRDVVVKLLCCLLVPAPRLPILAGYLFFSGFLYFFGERAPRGETMTRERRDLHTVIGSELLFLFFLFVAAGLIGYLVAFVELG